MSFPVWRRDTLRWPVSLAAVLLCWSHQCRGVELSPLKIDVGEVKTGAIAEAGIRVYWGNVIARSEAATVDLPEWVKLLESSNGVQEFNAGNKDYTELILSIDTTAQGEFSGEIKVLYGAQEAVVPVSAAVVAHNPQRKNLRVLLAGSPFEPFATREDSYFDPWRELVRESGADVSYRYVAQNGSVLGETDISQYDVILLAIGGILNLSDAETEKLDLFVVQGGRLILAPQRFMVGTVDRVNTLVEPLGITVFDTEARGGYHNDVVTGAGIAQSYLTAGVDRLKFFRGSPVAITDATTASILAFDPSGTGGFLARTVHGSGEVIVIAQSLICRWVGDSPGNGKLMQNLLTLPVSNE